MFCHFNNLFISSSNQLDLLNIHTFDYVVNINPENLNYNLFKNVINYNIDFFNIDSFNAITNLYDFILLHLFTKKILIINNENNIADVFFIFFLMKFYNKNYDTVFNMLQLNIDTSLKKQYSFLRKFIHNNYNSDLMDVC
jgi:hypothetical protein